MATDWGSEMQRLEKAEAVIGEFRQRFGDIDRRFDDVDRRFDEVDRRFDVVNRRLDDVDRRLDDVDRRFDDVDRRFDDVDRRFDDVDRRFDDLEQRLTSKINVQGEHFESLVKTLADNVAGSLEGISRELKDFRTEMQEQSRQTTLILANHEGRIASLEHRTEA